MTLDPLDQKVVDDIAKFGWSGIHVPEDDEGPGFSYSIGFWESLAAPEVIVFGLNGDLMHNVLWEMFHQLKAGKRLTDGECWSNLIESHDCISRPVHSTRIKEYFGYAIWYRRYRAGNPQLAAFQLFWPGKGDRLYPWEEGAHAAVRRHQPLLYLPAGEII